MHNDNNDDDNNVDSTSIKERKLYPSFIYINDEANLHIYYCYKVIYKYRL